MKSKKFVQIDEEGYPLFDGIRVSDEEIGSSILKSIQVEKQHTNTYFTLIKGDKITLEPFDEPYVARQIILESNKWSIQLPYRLKMTFDLKTLTLDEWDRFHGVTDSMVPFVLSRPAQNEFFNLLDSYDDDSITHKNKTYKIPNWLSTEKNPNMKNFWEDLYKEHNLNPPWNMNSPHPMLKTTLMQLKIPKNRILVLGGGYGHDAAFFAEQGHIVTCVDFSDEAVENGKKLYGHLSNLKFLNADIFNLPQSFDKSFDILFEHTCYCAIDPKRRNELVKIWRSKLADRGHLLGLFFVHGHNGNLPFGGSEWEIRERLKKHFSFLYWTRWQGDSSRAPGMELIIYAQKL